MPGKANDPALVERVVSLWNGGSMSFQEIADHPDVNRSRAAVTGIIQRARAKHPHWVRCGESPIKPKAPPAPERIRGGLPPLPSEVP